MPRKRKVAATPEQRSVEPDSIKRSKTEKVCVKLEEMYSSDTRVPQDEDARVPDASRSLQSIPAYEPPRAPLTKVKTESHDRDGNAATIPKTNVKPESRARSHLAQTHVKHESSSNGKAPPRVQDKTFPAPITVGTDELRPKPATAPPKRIPRACTDCKRHHRAGECRFCRRCQKYHGSHVQCGQIKSTSRPEAYRAPMARMLPPIIQPTYTIFANNGPTIPQQLDVGGGTAPQYLVVGSQSNMPGLDIPGRGEWMIARNPDAYGPGLKVWLPATSGLQQSQLQSWARYAAANPWAWQGPPAWM